MIAQKDSSEPILPDNKDWRSKCSEQDVMNTLLEEEVTDLPLENGIVRAHEIVEWRDCPVCDSKDVRQLFCKRGFVFVQCVSCSRVYVHNQLRSEVLQRLYRESKADKVNLDLQANEHHKRYWDLVYDKYFALISQNTCLDPGIIDVGCGAGNFVKFVLDRHPEWDVRGLELNKHAAPIVEGIVGPARFYDQPIEEIDFERKFGQIYMWGVLEHLVEPKKVLRKIRAILDPEGYFVFLIPNFKSRASRLLGVHTPTFEPRSHIQFFTRESLQWVYKEIGFEEVAVHYELPVIDLMYPFIDYSKDLALEINDRGESYYELHIVRRVD